MSIIDDHPTWERYPPEDPETKEDHVCSQCEDKERCYGAGNEQNRCLLIPVYSIPQMEDM